MQWSWRLLRVRGIDVRIHATFLVFLAWIALASRARGASPGDTAVTILVTLAVFASVLLHEFGHVLVAQHFGVSTRRITLLPIGGIAELERMPRRPREELLVALAGPLVNVVIGAALLAGLAMAGHSPGVPEAGIFGAGRPVERLFWVQVSLVTFNALPAFPMDGGRVLRALLAMRMDYVRATRIAVGLGQALGLGFAFLGLMGNVLLVLIGLLVMVSAQAERTMVETRTALEGVPSRSAVEGQIRSLAPDDTLDVAARELLAGAQRDFPVAAHGALVGVLTREGLIAGLQRLGAGGAVSGAMTPDVVAVEASTPLPDVLDRLHAAHARLAALMDHGAMVGLVTEENILELLMVRRALQAHGST